MAAAYCLRHLFYPILCGLPSPKILSSQDWRCEPAYAEPFKPLDFLADDPRRSLRCISRVVPMCAAYTVATSRVLGKISYSLYAWHLLVFAVLTKFSAQFAWMTPYSFGFLIVLPITVAVAAASYYVIERPFLNYRYHYVTNQRLREAAI
jgi:hypothetical protein